MAERLLSEGARVACVDVSARRMEPSVAALQAPGVDVHGYVCDVGSREDVQTLFARIEQDFAAPVGVLVNNAVWARFQPLGEIDPDTVNRMFAVGMNGSIWTLQAVAPQMKRRGGGSVINLCSTSALQAMPNSIAYAALKAGVLGLTRAAAVELSPHNIRVNAIVPGMIGTPASIAQFEEETITQRLQQMPLRRFGDPKEIAALTAFLASDDSSYIQGAAIVADGGWTIAST